MGHFQVCQHLTMASNFAGHIAFTDLVFAAHKDRMCTSTQPKPQGILFRPIHNRELAINNRAFEGIENTPPK